MGESGFVGSYSTPGLLLEAANKTAETQLLAEEAARNATRNATQRRQPFKANTSKQRRLVNEGFYLDKPLRTL